MTILTRAAKGSALSHSEMDNNLVELRDHMGWVDYNDLATATTPIALTAADTFYDMPNDGLGTLTNKAYKIAAHGEIWNAGTGRFDFTSLSLGDTVAIRFDFSVTTGGANREIVVNLDLGLGGTPYSLTFANRSYKASGTFAITETAHIYMGDTNTLDNPGKFSISNDGTGGEVKVNGWFVTSFIRGV